MPLDELVGAPASGDPRIHPRLVSRNGVVRVPLEPAVVERHVDGCAAIRPARRPPNATSRALFGTGEGRWHLRPVTSAAGPCAFETAIVADLREAVSRYPADPELAALVDGLRATSPFFGEMWSVAGMGQLTGDLQTIGHPELGDLVLDCDVLTVPGVDLRIVT